METLFIYYFIIIVTKSLSYLVLSFQIGPPRLIVGKEFIS